jgi:hypothetical protein
MLLAVLFAVVVASLLAGLAILATAYSTESPGTFLSGHGTSIGVALILVGCILGIVLEAIRMAP